MVLLVAFAFVAGAGTALSPCVLPVLPALLSAGATGGRRRPLGIVLGLTVTFTVTIVGLATVVDGVGLGDSLVRDLAIVALFGFGLAVAVPRIGEGIRLREPDGMWASYDVLDVWYQKAEFGDVWMPYLHVRMTPGETAAVGAYAEEYDDGFASVHGGH